MGEGKRGEAVLNNLSVANNAPIHGHHEYAGLIIRRNGNWQACRNRHFAFLGKYFLTEQKFDGYPGTTPMATANPDRKKHRSNNFSSDTIPPLPETKPSKATVAHLVLEKILRGSRRE